MKGQRRAGVAALEFVLVFPLLLTLMVCGWWMAHAGFMKIGSLTEARRQAWQNRAQATAGIPYDIKQHPLHSGVNASMTVQGVGRPPVIDVPNTATSSAMMTDRTWDHVDFPFPEISEKMTPHVKQLGDIARFVPEIAPLVERVRGYRQMDLQSSGDYQAEIRTASHWKRERSLARTSISREVPKIPRAITILQNLVKTKPLMAIEYNRMINGLRDARPDTIKLPSLLND